MNWNQIEGRWDQLAGQVKSQWGKLTDDDLTNIAGKRQQLVGKLQERYGALKGDIEKQVNQWLGKMEADPIIETMQPAGEAAAPQDAEKMPRPAPPSSSR